MNCPVKFMADHFVMKSIGYFPYWQKTNVTCAFTSVLSCPSVIDYTASTNTVLSIKNIEWMRRFLGHRAAQDWLPVK